MYTRDVAVVDQNVSGTPSQLSITTQLLAICPAKTLAMPVALAGLLETI